MKNSTIEEKIEMIQTLMNSLDEEFSNLANAVREDNFPLSRMLFIRAEYFHQMSKNYNSLSSGDNIGNMKKEIQVAKEILKTK